LTPDREDFLKNFGMLPPTPESKFQDLLFSGVFQNEVFSKGLFYTTPPCEVCLVLSDNASQSLFIAFTSLGVAAIE
jgi:hypothetical protein